MLAFTGTEVVGYIESPRTLTIEELELLNPELIDYILDTTPITDWTNELWGMIVGAYIEENWL